MTTVNQLGPDVLSREEILAQLDKFLAIYDERPLSVNDGGMLLPHMFATWCFVSKISPNLIVESGVWKGQGTWMLQKAAPDCQIICLDPAPSVQL